MGHRDSSATLSGAGALRNSGGGIVAPAAQHRSERPSVGELSAAVSIPARALLIAVRVYQMFFSALMPSACKFYPTCSHYAAEAVRLHGARRGSWLALWRLARCHPFTRGGVDLVPDAAGYSRQAHAASETTIIENTGDEVHL
jgi:putative membrane protein insertion efficiency factor